MSNGDRSKCIAHVVHASLGNHHPMPRSTMGNHELDMPRTKFDVDRSVFTAIDAEARHVRHTCQRPRPRIVETDYDGSVDTRDELLETMDDLAE